MKTYSEMVFYQCKTDKNVLWSGDLSILIFALMKIYSKWWFWSKKQWKRNLKWWFIYIKRMKTYLNSLFHVLLGMYWMATQVSEAVIHRCKNNKSVLQFTPTYYCWHYFNNIPNSGDSDHLFWFSKISDIFLQWGVFSFLNSFGKRISKFENIETLQKLIFGFFFVRSYFSFKGLLNRWKKYFQIYWNKQITLFHRLLDFI